MNIGFIGLGNMGSGMAANLLNFCHQQGHGLHLWDVNNKAVKDLLEQTVHATGSSRATYGTGEPYLMVVKLLEDLDNKPLRAE